MDTSKDLPDLPQGYTIAPIDYTGDVYLESQMKEYGHLCAKSALMGFSKRFSSGVAVVTTDEITNHGEKPCSEHPDAPHGFDRNASHSAGHYVCDCYNWNPD